jgi:3-oxoacyl-[acyl-carrier protein] reductase
MRRRIERELGLGCPRRPAAQQKALAETHPLRRLGTPDDVAAAAVFLASDDSAWITGIIVDVAGGA